MNSPRPLRLVMAPLVCCLTLAAFETASAAPAKKSLPPVPAPVVEAPAPKKSFLKKLNPFQKKEAPPAVTPPPVLAKNSKKSAPAPEVEPKPPVKSIANAKTLPPTPPAALEEPKKAGFFARLKSKLNEDPDGPAAGEKPARPLDWKERWVVTDESTAFFEYGPSQANGPDLRLPRGQVVKLTEAKRGWARVELEGGRQGYIGTDQMRQASENDFSSPILPAGTQLAAVGIGSSLQGWSPIAPPPDLPDLPMAAGMEDSLLLLPPLEFEGTELKKSSLRLRPLDGSAPTLKPGDTLPTEAPAAALEPPVLDLEKEEVPALPAPTEPAPPIPSPPAAEPAPAAPAPETAPSAPSAPSPETPAPAPAEPAAPSPTV